MLNQVNAKAQVLRHIPVCLALLLQLLLERLRVAQPCIGQQARLQQESGKNGDSLSVEDGKTLCGAAVHWPASTSAAEGNTENEDSQLAVGGAAVHWPASTSAAERTEKTGNSQLAVGGAAVHWSLSVVGHKKGWQMFAPKTRLQAHIVKLALRNNAFCVLFMRLQVC